MNARVPLTVLLSLLVDTAPASAQGPLPRTYDLVVADSTGDNIVRLRDLTQSGVFAAPGENTVYYDAANTDGGPLTGNPSSLAFDSRGYLYVTDTSGDMCLRTIDKVGNGQAQFGAQGEWGIFFDSTNASGLTFPTPLAIVVSKADVLWGVNSGVGSAPLDFVYTAQDYNGDGDAQDIGELRVVYDSTNGSVNMGVPSALAIDPATGDVLVSDVNPDTIYRLVDLDGSGDYYSPGEVQIAYSATDPTAPGLSNANTLRFAQNGDLFVNDSSLGQILRLRDLNGDGDYDDANEATVWADSAANPLGVPQTCFGIDIDESGRVFAVETSSSALDGVVVFEDKNADGDANDAGEVTVVYDNNAGPGNIINPRALALVPAPTMSSQNGPTVSPGMTLTLDVKGFEHDEFQMLFGVQSLGGVFKAPPYGYLSFLPLPFALDSGLLDANGHHGLGIAVPVSGVPLGLTIHFVTAVGKAPFRTYLTNEVSITIQ